MAVIAGKFGKIMIGAVEVAQVMDWDADLKTNLPAWASSSTAQHKTRIAGVSDATGSCTVKLDDVTTQWSVLAQGTVVTLLLYLNAALFITMPAIVESFAVSVNINEGDAVQAKITWGATAAPWWSA